MRKIIPFLFVLYCLILAYGCRYADDHNGSKENIADLSEQTQTIIDSMSQADSLIVNDTGTKLPVKVIEGWQPRPHRMDTIIDDYMISYKMRQSADTTDLIGPFDIHRYTPINENSSSYDTVLYYRAGEVIISIAKIKDNSILKDDTIIINRKILADCVGADIDSLLSCFAIASVYLDNVDNDIITFLLGFYKEGTDIGWNIDCIWADCSYKFYIETFNWDWEGECAE